MENVATTSVCTNGKYDANLAATVKGLLETTSAQSLIHTWVQDQPHYLQLLTPLLTISEPYLKVLPAPRVPDRDLLIYVTVADSGLSMVSGKKRKLRKYDFAERLDASRPARVGAWRSEMLWGKGLQQLCKRLAALIDEVRTDYPAATIIPMIYWNGNELVGKDGLEPTGTYPYDTPIGDAEQLLADTKRHLAWTRDFAARKGCACLGVMTGAKSYLYGFSMIWERFMTEVRDYIIGDPSNMFVYVDATPFVETIDLLDRYHMCFSDDNITKTVQFMRGTHHMLYMLSILRPAMGSVAELTRSHDYTLRPIDVLEVRHQEDCTVNVEVLAYCKETLTKCGVSLSEMIGLPFTREEVEFRQPLDFAPVNPAEFATSGEPSGADVSESVRPARAGAKAAAVAQRDEATSRPVPLDSYGRSVTGGHYDCWVYSIHDGVKYVDYGEGPKRLEIIKQPSFDYDPSVRRISNEYHSSLTCISKVLRGRGTEGCGYVMDEDGYVDLEDLGLALRKELRHPIPWNIQNIMDIFKLDKKQRFIALGCPDASRCGDVPCSHWIFKIKASQGHEDWLQIDDSGIAKEWYVNPGTDLGRWSGWNVCSTPPTVLYHRTDKRNFTGIMRNGLLPGGGDQHETGRPHVYFADIPSTNENYISGVRANKPLEIQIDLRMAIRAGLCFFKTESDGVLTRDKVPNYTIISVLDATNGDVWYTRSEQSDAGAPAEATEDEPQGMKRDQAVVDDRSTALERIATTRTNVASPRAPQGEAKRQKTFNPMENVEMNVATCPVCNNSVFEGQVHCTSCGQLSPLNPRLLKEQQKIYLVQRSNLLKKMGLSTHVTAQVLASVGTFDLREEDRSSILRGLNSPDSAVLQEARKKHKSALKNGYHSLLDRYELDMQYRVRMLEVGRRDADILRMELCANLVLAAPKQSQAQRTLGVGLGSTSESRIARLAYIKTELEFLPSELQDALSSRWIIMFQGMPYSPRAFVNIVSEQDKPRSIGCWNGIIHLRSQSLEDLRREMDWVFGQNERYARNSIEFAKNESSKHLARNAARYADTRAPAAREGEHWSQGSWQNWSGWGGWDNDSGYSTWQWR